MFKRIDPFGNPNVGVYVRATDSLLLLPPGLTAQNRSDIEEALGLTGVEATIGGSPLLGSLVVANGRGAVVADFATDAEVAVLKEAGLEVLRLKHARLNAAGNNLLANDHGCLAHPELSNRNVEAVSDVLGVEVVRQAIAGVPTVGTAAVATRGGVLAHPLATEDELAFLKQLMGVPARIGTVNHGHGLVGAGIAANSNGAVAGGRTTGIELGRIEEALGFLS
ncbi:MAG: translation initiation factor IF-6 [Thermoplasmatota archaeon]